MPGLLWTGVGSWRCWRCSVSPSRCGCLPHSPRCWPLCFCALAPDWRRGIAPCRSSLSSIAVKSGGKNMQALVSDSIFSCFLRWILHTRSHGWHGPSAGGKSRLSSGRVGGFFEPHIREGSSFVTIVSDSIFGCFLRWILHTRSHGWHGPSENQN